MSYISQAATCAATIQGKLNDNFNAGNSMLLEPLPFLEFLASQANNYGLEQKMILEKGKTRTIQLKYMQRLIDSDIDSNASSAVCSGGDSLGDTSTTYTLSTDENRYKTQLINSDDLECTEDEFSTYLAAQIDRLMDGVERAVSVKTVAEAITLFGNWSADAISAYSIEADELVIDDSDLKNFHKVFSAAVMTGYGQQKAVFGGQLFYDFMQYAKAGCCSSTGIDLGSLWNQFGIAAMYDRHLAEALGGAHSKALLTQPGAMALLNYTKAGWKDGSLIAKEGANYVKFAMFSPRTGLRYDVTITDNCENVTLDVRGTTKLVGLPTDMWTTNDNFEGVTYVNKIKVS